MKQEQIAAQLFTLREFLKTEEDIYNTLKKVSEIGFRAVQISGMAKIDTYKLKNMLNEFSLTVCATHTPFERLKNEIESVIEEHKILGCYHIAIPSAPNEFRSFEGALEFAKECNEIGKKLKEENISLSYHNHSFEFKRYNSKTWLEILIENSDPQLLMFEIDTYWVQFAGASPEKWIRKLKGRIPLVHLKDMGMLEDFKQGMFEVGFGNLDWDGIIEACIDAGVQWYIIEQDICQRSPFESLRLSLDFLTKNYVK
ncbi:sugar phosphate isomerase/epimerase [Caldicellulosiruptor changbaiensis]|uniref:Sugar phosphate isomerase/epimerase n=1 Tax=Caldicellulosiruptor changbaiensis TaxID=1222016 RepID=A0A3T0D826_9FIRM|nr:sugar phosphate isomerase/epimerase [Caldicellulosiruptor changbaiensis]AZT91290.1 sugar phosphate isomerase/epimerase [Caldicellulosiruptor changbaiensis]